MKASASEAGLTSLREEVSSLAVSMSASELTVGGTG
jgi:hypothetical protein